MITIVLVTMAGCSKCAYAWKVLHHLEDEYENIRIYKALGKDIGKEILMKHQIQYAPFAMIYCNRKFMGVHKLGFTPQRFQYAIEEIAGEELVRR